MRFQSAIFGSLVCLGCFVCLPSAAFAYSPLTFRYEHHLFTLDPDAYPGWNTPQEIWMYEGQEIIPPAAWRVDGDDLPPLPAGVARGWKTGWNKDVIRSSLEKKIGSVLGRSAGTVTIKGGSGSVKFEGVGLTGREVDTDLLASLTMTALDQGAGDIVIPVTEIQPVVTVENPQLRAMGIKEVVTIGESNFTGSPVNRRHNIGVGLSKFNGHLIPQGTVFSFGKTLGRVDGSTGYRKELVIKGDRTEPDYGGGLCQVSTTAYRGVWEYGFPIEQRKNHSYAVSYYGPQGTDATVYPPNPDMKFKNDSPGALLMQTYQENNRAYFIYYGTRDARTADVWGPLVLGTSAPPPDRTLMTMEIPVGTKRKVGDRHPGITVKWYRQTQMPGAEPTIEPVLSIYEARPLFYEVGVEAMPTPAGDINTTVPPTIF